MGRRIADIQNSGAGVYCLYDVYVRLWDESVIAVHQFARRISSGTEWDGRHSILVLSLAGAWRAHDVPLERL